MTFDAAKHTPPGPTRCRVPSLSNSTVPSRISISSECRCLCGGCGMCPGNSAVSCASTASPVGRTPFSTARDSPFGPFFTGSCSNGYARCTDSTVSAGAAVIAEPAWPSAGRAAANAAREESATQRSRRFMFIMARILLRRRGSWHHHLVVYCHQCKNAAYELRGPFIAGCCSRSPSRMTPSMVTGVCFDFR